MYQNVNCICISQYGKICSFPLKNADVSRPKVMCHGIRMFFGSSLGKVSLCHISSLEDVWCVRNYRKEGLFCPLHPWAVSKKPILNRLSVLPFLNLICQKFDMKNIIKIIFIIIIIIKVNIIKIYTKNTNFITRKCDVTYFYQKGIPSSANKAVWNSYIAIFSR